MLTNLKKIYNTLKTPVISRKFTAHNFFHCALSYCVKTVCVVEACEARMPAVLRLQIGDRVSIKLTTLENKGFYEENL